MNPDDDKTRMIRKTRIHQKQAEQNHPTAEVADEDATRIIRPNKASVDIVRGSQVVPECDDDATRILRPSSAEIPVTGDSDGSKTKLMRRKPSGGVSQQVSSVAPGFSVDDPVTGWLVVIDGPGKGGQVPIGEQDNHVGRGGGDTPPRVCLNFGDVGISRSNAFVLRYDPKKRRFKILPGEGTNIVYLNDEDLDSPVEIKAGDVIEVSESKLRFIPFCGSDFDWVDTESA